MSTSPRKRARSDCRTARNRSKSPLWLLLRLRLLVAVCVAPNFFATVFLPPAELARAGFLNAAAFLVATFLVATLLVTFATDCFLAAAAGRFLATDFLADVAFGAGFFFAELLVVGRFTAFLVAVPFFLATFFFAAVLLADFLVVFRWLTAPPADFELDFLRAAGLAAVRAAFFAERFLGLKFVYPVNLGGVRPGW